jgi:hypothetical protein
VEQDALGGFASGVGSAHSSRAVPESAPTGTIPAMRPLPLLLTAVLVAACAGSTASASPSTLVVGGSGGPSVVPALFSSETVVGPDRVLIGLLDATGTTPIGTPDYQVSIGFINVDKDKNAFVITPAPATFVWAIPDQRAVWFSDVTFNAAGNWAAVVTVTPPGKAAESTELGLPVSATGQAIRVGAKAPSTPTPTSASAGGVLASITTDTSPNPAFYQLSEDQALVQHKPFVLVFATPAFCTSRVCGPTLEAVKAVARGEPTMTFIQVEPYIMNYANGTLQPVLGSGNSLQPNAATTAWGIQSEPWVFVVDSTGTVTASYEAVIVPTELTAAIDKVKSGS